MAQRVDFRETNSFKDQSTIDSMQELIRTRPIDPSRTNKLSPISCESCSEIATVEALTELENIIAVHRYCNTCLKSML